MILLICIAVGLGLSFAHAMSMRNVVRAAYYSGQRDGIQKAVRISTELSERELNEASAGELQVAVARARMGNEINNQLRDMQHRVGKL